MRQRWREAEGKSPVRGQLASRRNCRVGRSGVDVSPSALDGSVEAQGSSSDVGEDTIDGSHRASACEDLVAVYPSEELRRVFPARGNGVGDLCEVPKQTEPSPVEIRS